MKQTIPFSKTCQDILQPTYQILNKYSDNVYSFHSFSINLYDDPEQILTTEDVDKKVLDKLEQRRTINRQPKKEFTTSLPDSFLNKPVNYLRDVVCKNRIFLVVGGGPSGMKLSLTLSKTFPNYNVIILDNRIVAEHRREPFSRLRVLAGVNNIVLSELEKRLYEQLKERPNVYFYFSQETNIDSIAEQCQPRFVFNATGGRLNMYHNQLAQETIILDKDYGKIIKYINSEYYYNDPDGDIGPLITDDNYIYLTIDIIITISQGTKSIDVNVKNIPSFIGTMRYNQLQEYIIDIETIALSKTELIDVLANKFDSSQDYKVNWFISGFKFSKRLPVDMHRITSGEVFFKFDIGDSLATVPISVGTNISYTEQINKQNLIPALKELIQQIDNPDVKNCLSYQN